MMQVVALMKSYIVKTRTLASSLRLKMAKIRSQANMRRTTVKIAGPAKLTNRGQVAKLVVEARYKRNKKGH